MKYFKLYINTALEEIVSSAKVKIASYYDTDANNINDFMLRTIDKDMTFAIFNDDGVGFESIFSFDEKVRTLDEAFEHIRSIFSKNFGVTNTIKTPEEISMIDYDEYLCDANRKSFVNRSNRMAKIANNLVYSYDFAEYGKDGRRFIFDELIIGKTPVKTGRYLVDSSLSDEIKRINDSKNQSIPSDSKIHYVISAGNKAVADSISNRILTPLYEAGRIGSRRVELIYDINPISYINDNLIEQIVCNSYDGVIRIDLSTKFGRESSDYVKTSQYIVDIVKKYNKDCTFIFTYNSVNPGFANFVLDELTSFLPMVSIKEGYGDKNSVTKYIKSMAMGTDYEPYIECVDEFMAPYKNTTYSETEALELYDSFTSWVLKNKRLSMYSNCTLSDFQVNNAVEQVSAIEELDNMIGLAEVKRIIYRMIDTAIVNKRRQEVTGVSYTNTMNMIFYGEPGTAKSTVAKLVGKIAKEKHILQSGVYVKLDGGSICPDDVSNAFIQAKGGVLFIDEAYAIGPGSLITLLQLMEECRNEVIVILAGYEGAMKHFLSRNEGLRSRIPNMVEFPSYSADELTEIFKLMLKNDKLTMTDSGLEIASEIFAKARIKSGFGNGRYVRELLEDAKKNQASRLMKKYGDINLAPNRQLLQLNENDITIPNGIVKVGNKSSDAYDDFNNLIGLNRPKEIINRAIKKYKAQKVFKSQGLPTGNSTMHMVFTGNPGTAKTTVAKYFGEVMRAEGLLSTGAFVAASKGDLVSPMPGVSAQLVRSAFESAKGGVLFIDEAYALCEGAHGGPGDEAINTIIEEMETHREDLVVIFAGYPYQMKEFIDRNPGMKSRIANYVPFDDYTTDELVDITKLCIKNFKLNVTDAAIEKIRAVCEAGRQIEGFGNGRFSRTIAEEARDNLLCRVADMDPTKLTKKKLTTILPEDINEPTIDIKLNETKRKFGFAS